MDLVLSDSVGFKMLYIAYDEEKDTELADRLQNDLTKIMAGSSLMFPSPSSQGPTRLPAAPS